jgi:hypothetical protein
MHPYLMQSVAEERIKEMHAQAASRRQVREARRARRAALAEQARRGHESLPGRVVGVPAARTREHADHASAGEHRGYAGRRAA